MQGKWRGKIGRALPHSKTLRDIEARWGIPPGLGLLQSSGALASGEGKNGRQLCSQRPSQPNSPPPECFAYL